jgi:hypothetical protein
MTPKNIKSSASIHPSRRSLMPMATSAKANGPTIIQESRPKKARIEDMVCAVTERPPQRLRAFRRMRMARAAAVSDEWGRTP